MQHTDYRHKAPPGTTMGLRVRGLRGFRGWSRPDLARESGVSVNTIASIESGHNTNPTTETLRQLAKTLGVPLGWIVSGDEGEVDAAPARARAA